ncbi:MAG: hypothetical protein PHT52_07170 [Eubacteriales bacterium]|nr:hypothetical protein [Eubacteriales bacterium]MDD4079550.1 hypothetical protein [Eubacteriales bacterium]MDD4769559.1 hypothetical protein [Eubacteriales bacterium]
MKKYVALLLLMVFLVATLSGCGLIKKFIPGDLEDLIPSEDPDGKDPDGEDPDVDDPDGDDPDSEDPDVEEPTDGDVVVEGNIFYPADWKDILNTFAEFGFTYKEVKEDGEESTWSMYYVSEGTEEVDGVEAEVIHFTKIEDSTEESRIWCDSDWNCIKLEVNGEEAEPWGNPLGMFLMIYVNWVELTQMTLSTDGTIDTSEYKLEETSSESTEVGNLEVYSFASLWTTVVNHYGFHQDGDLYFALIRNTLKGSNQLSELRITHLNPR